MVAPSPVPGRVALGIGDGKARWLPEVSVLAVEEKQNG